VEKMWNSNPDSAIYLAAICYKKDYSLQDNSLISNVTSVELTSGALNTEYVEQALAMSWTTQMALRHFWSIH
jgi:hypothetical protein